MKNDEEKELKLIIKADVQGSLDPIVGEMEKLGDGARLCIVGKGPQEEELKEYFGDMQDKVVFTGQLSGDELSKAFASADCFMMPSDSGE